MKIHFFTAPFYFAFIWFRVQALVAASPPQKEDNPASLRSAAPSIGRGSRGHSLPPSYGRRCPEGAEVGWGKRHEREWGYAFQAGD